MSLPPSTPLPEPAAEPASRRSRASGRVTLQDVADAAEVSPMTVSRALRGERRVAPALADKVREVAVRLGYVPDPAARALASQKSHQVLVIVPLLSNTLFVDLIEAAHKVLFAAGYHLLIGVSHYSPAEEEQLLRAYLPMRPAGLMLTGYERSAGSAQLLAASATACVHLMELHAEGAAAGMHSVGFSQVDAGVTMTQHLLAQGYRRIAFCGAQLDARVMQRLQGYRQALLQAGLADPGLEILSPERSSLALGGQLLEQVLQLGGGVDAVFFCNDDLAQGALLAANRLGLSIPGQLAIAGFNDLPGSAQMVPPLTTIHTPRSAIGAEAATMLLKLVQGQPVAHTRLDLGYHLVRRASA
ncbi:LacI family DNA-binding transcriptional regulator [Comamonas piscis]|nr:LacI family DNA-binding transcriptional regulator [Comamonas piscis]WSO32328.1 LacI family DNA-binding transcriptional regulator [Comamonas piscis]